MKKTEKLYRQLKANQLIAFLTPANPAQCVEAYEILNPKGITLEIAFRTKHALNGIKATINKYPDALLLAGTIMTAADAISAIEAGAAGIVSSDFISAVTDACVENDIMYIPGGLSDAGKQLAKKAAIYGCGLNELMVKYPYQWIYKLFPAVTSAKSNTDIAMAWKGPYNDLSVVYAGGITEDNLPELLAADPKGIICASALTTNVDSPALMEKDIETWTEIINSQKKHEKIPSKRIYRKKEDIKKIITFGEIMLRLSPPSHQRFIQARSFDATYGGAEANVAVSLSNFGLNSYFVTAVPDNELGTAALNAVRNLGVKTKYAIRNGHRLGIYFLEHGASQRPSKVIYDRTGTAMSDLLPGQIDWDAIFQDAGWFHWSGITPAVGHSAETVTRQALKAAHKAGVTISVDLNYREKMWTQEKASSVMSSLMEYVDICFCNEEDAEKIFGIKAESSIVATGKLVVSSYKDVAAQLAERFNFTKVAITLRESINATENLLSACIFDGQQFIKSDKYKIHIIDRVGSGDAFSAGLIYGIISGLPDKEALEFAVAAACLKHTIHGDFNIVTAGEVERLAAGNSSGRVIR